MSTRRELNAWAGMSMGVHLRPGVELASTVYPDEDRAVIKVRGENFTDLSLFADRADLDRLVDTVTAARDELAAATATATATASTTDTASTPAVDAA